MRLNTKVTPMGNRIALLEQPQCWSVIRFSTNYSRFINLVNLDTRDEALRFIEDFFANWKNMRN